MKAMGQKVKGTIVWSSSRLGNHDLFTMKTDGSDVKAITHGDEVDWFPRFSPDGSQILFCRSKKGWVSERDANNSDKWDIYTVTPDGSSDRRRWSTAPAGAAGSRRTRSSSCAAPRSSEPSSAPTKETEIMDSEGVSDLDGALLAAAGAVARRQVRGHHPARLEARDRDLGHCQEDLDAAPGSGCQINWTPDGDRHLLGQPDGQRRQRDLQHAHQGRQAGQGAIRRRHAGSWIYPGRRSHEYFPELSADGKWMVWGITQRGHDHDIADYEIYLWEVGTPPESGVRLTYHSANDRWPDIFIPGAAPQAALPPPAAPESAQTASAPRPAGSRASRAGIRQDRAATRRRPRRHPTKAGKKHRAKNMMPLERIAILGAGGFIGSHLVPALLRRGADDRRGRRRLRQARRLRSPRASGRGSHRSTRASIEEVTARAERRHLAHRPLQPGPLQHPAARGHRRELHRSGAAGQAAAPSAACG